MSCAALRMVWNCFGLVKPVRMVQSEERRCHTVVFVTSGDSLWTCFSMLIAHCFPSCCCSGDFWFAGAELLQHPEFLCWLGLPVWLWDSATRKSRALCWGRALPRAVGVFLKGQQGRFGVFGLGKQEWELLQGEPVLSHHTVKEMHLQHSWLQPVCIQKAPTSLIQVQSQSQLVLILPCSWPSSFSPCLCCLSDSSERGRLAAASSMNTLDWGRSLVEISAELDPAAPLLPYKRLCCLFCLCASAQPLPQCGRQGGKASSWFRR